MCEAPKREKVFVAVHGVGDQFSCQTSQAVARQVFKYFDFVGALPLGWLYGEINDDSGRFSYRKICPGAADSGERCRNGSYDSKYGCVSFSEVYWAGTPRKAIADGHIIEETKRWARTIVERLRVRDERHEKGAFLDKEAYKTTKQVLTELISAVGLMEHLLCWLGKRTPFNFQLKKVLEDYVCDVQVVTEYEKLREEILTVFTAQMRKIRHSNPHAEIYIIAHSEGTVVALLALLRALADCRCRNAWVQNVYGFMTLGSPIDKHLVLWPELWREFECGKSGRKISWQALKNQEGKDRKIPWYNYYDYGDPVGFELDYARDWLKIADSPPLDLQEKTDIGFSRYMFPGKAHTDYWNDGSVFVHFFENVVMKDYLAPRVKDLFTAPKSKLHVTAISGILPYLLVTALCGIGTYLLYKATASSLKLHPHNLPVNVVLLTLSLTATTAAARLPRLTRAPWSYMLSILLGLVAFSLPLSLTDIGQTTFTMAVLNGAGKAHRASSLGQWPVISYTAASISVIGWIFSRKASKSGMLPMLFMGALAIALFLTGLAAHNLSEPHPSDLHIWPIAVAAVTFIYFWWIAALLFDLSFIWHRYVCLNVGNEKMRKAAHVSPPPTPVKKRTAYEMPWQPKPKPMSARIHESRVSTSGPHCP